MAKCTYKYLGTLITRYNHLRRLAPGYKYGPYLLSGLNTLANNWRLQIYLASLQFHLGRLQAYIASLQIHLQRLAIRVTTCKQANHIQVGERIAVARYSVTKGLLPSRVTHGDDAPGTGTVGVDPEAG